MSRQHGGKPGSGSGAGFDSQVEYAGQSFLVQTQCSTRDVPVVESLVYQDGQVLVRITSSYGDVADRCGFTEDDGRHLLELQHADLVRKIRHGMLRGNDPAAGPEPARMLDAGGNAVDLAEIDEPAVRELLSDLGVAIEEAGTPPPMPSTDTRRQRRRLRLVIRIAWPH